MAILRVGQKLETFSFPSLHTTVRGITHDHLQHVLCRWFLVTHNTSNMLILGFCSLNIHWWEGTGRNIEQG